MFTHERISRRDFNRRALLLVSGGLVLAAGCSGEAQPLQGPEAEPSQEPLVKWSTVEVPLNKTIHANVKGLDNSQLHITDLFVYSSSSEPFVWYSVVLEKQNPNSYQMDFLLARYKQDFILNESNELLGIPPVEDIPYQSHINAFSDLLRAIPPGSDILNTRPVKVITPILKPADSDNYVFVFKSSNVEYNLKGFIPVKFTFEPSNRGIA